MYDLNDLFNRASGFADAYNGSERAYIHFTNAAIEYEQSGGDRDKVDDLIDRSIASLYRATDFLSLLTEGGSHIYEYDDTFVSPKKLHGVLPGSKNSYKGPIYDARLQEIVRVLGQNKIFFDDLVIDAGAVKKMQMRKWPYVIINIPRLNAQIAVANQYGEALFIANPSIDIDQWLVFQKEDAGKPDTVFSRIKRVTFAGAWQKQMLDALFGALTEPGKKIELKEFVAEREANSQNLMEKAIVAAAKLYRERHPDKQWPNPNSSILDSDLAKLINGKDDKKETWKNLDNLARIGGRGLTKGQSLSIILKKNGCAYEITESQIAEIGKLSRDRHPQRKWPNQKTGTIHPEIVIAVTGDPHWQSENWDNLRNLLLRGGRGLAGGKKLTQLFDEHYPKERSASAALEPRKLLGPS